MSNGELLDLSTKRESAPAKAWKNWWRSLTHSSHTCLTCGYRGPLRCGEAYQNHCRVYPSKDVAESDAAKLPHPSRIYLGAYPEGESPP